MKKAGKTWKELEKAAMDRDENLGNNGNLWSLPYVPPRCDEDYSVLL